MLGEKKILKRMLIVALIAVYAMLFASCGKDDGGSKNKDTDTKIETVDTLDDFIQTYDPTTTATEYVDADVTTKYDFEGHEFKFLNSDAIWSMYVYLDPEMTGDVLDDACYERNFLVENYFNITLTEETQPFETLSGYAKTLILTGEDVYDAMYIPAQQLTPLLSENLFVDLLEIDELNIDKLWWDQPLIERNIIENRLFYATSDLHLMAFDGIWCMYFNEDMMNELGLELPFQLALDGKWTFDELKKYCSAAANLNGDATFVFDKDGNATYGLSVAINAGAAGYLAYGMGTEAATRDENGKYRFTADTDQKFSDTWTSLVNFFGPDDGMAILASGNDTDPAGYYGVFEADRSLFLHGELKGATMLREWEGKFGLLPQPKYNEAQETYNSNVLTNCLSFCIPTTNKNLSRTGIIVDYLTYMSYANLLPRYYDIHVARKALGRQESIDVLALIRGTRGIDASKPYCWTIEFDRAMNSLVLQNSIAISSTIESYRDSIKAAIDKTYSEYPTLNHVE